MTSFQRRIRPTPRKDEAKLIALFENKEEADQILTQCQSEALSKSSNAWRNWILEMTHLYFHFMTRYVAQKADATQFSNAIAHARLAAKTFAEFDGMQSHLQMNDRLFACIEKHVDEWIAIECSGDMGKFAKVLLIKPGKKLPTWYKHARFQAILQDLYTSVAEPRFYMKQLSIEIKRKKRPVEDDDDDLTTSANNTLVVPKTRRTNTTLLLLKQMQ